MAPFCYKMAAGRHLHWASLDLHSVGVCICVVHVYGIELIGSIYTYRD